MPTMADLMPELSNETRRAIEAILMVAEKPVEPQLLAQLLEIPVGPRRRALRGAGRRVRGRATAGFVLVRVAGGCRFQSHPDLAPYVERFVLEGQSARLSGAALETLAIVAYKQPVSRAQVAAIRGVNVDGVMRTLAAAGLHRRGRPRPRSGPGRPVRHDARCSSSGSGSTRSTTCRRSATSCPAPTSSSARGRAAPAARPVAGRAARRDRGRQRGARRGDASEIDLDEIDLDELDED